MAILYKVETLFKHLKDWLASIQNKYGVNPVIFAVIYLGGAIPFWYSIYRIVRGLRKKAFNEITIFSIILGIIICLPFSYVALFGYNIPNWFWIVVGCVIGISLFSALRKILKRC